MIEIIIRIIRRYIKLHSSYIIGIQSLEIKAVTYLFALALIFLIGALVIPWSYWLLA